MSIVIFFFFQAEDGIRDFHVTGVQTCALPISRHGLAYRTKGDANANRDPWTIRLAGHVGRVSFHVPFAGYVLFYAHTREVRGSLIAIAALLVLAGLLRRIWRTETAEPAGV